MYMTTTFHAFGEKPHFEVEVKVPEKSWDSDKPVSIRVTFPETKGYIASPLYLSVHTDDAYRLLMEMARAMSASDSLTSAQRHALIDYLDDAPQQDAAKPWER